MNPEFCCSIQKSTSTPTCSAPFKSLHNFLTDDVLFICCKCSIQTPTGTLTMTLHSHTHMYPNFNTISHVFAGFYCPEGQTVPNPNAYPCQPGYYCEEGSPTQQLCPSGTYQDEDQASSCKECPAGFYCDNAQAPIVNYTAYECPTGRLYNICVHYVLVALIVIVQYLTIIQGCHYVPDP